MYVCGEFACLCAADIQQCGGLLSVKHKWQNATQHVGFTTFHSDRLEGGTGVKQEAEVSDIV